MQTKIVGVVIPIYNVEEYLRECLDSVVNQTYKNLQVVLVNDGSTDENSLNIAKEYT
ncbi:glycosyltransferase family 2 protein, partial [Campylobacter jejuni]